MAFAVSRYVRVCIALLAMLASGCVALQREARPDSAVLLSVRLVDGAAPEVSGLIVSVADESGMLVRQFAFVPSQRVPQSYTNFLVRMDLPVGRYRLRNLTGIVNSASMPAFDVDAMLPFTARAGGIDYLGRVQLSRANATVGPTQAGASRLLRATLVDAHQEDLPALINAWPVLRAQGIEVRRSMHESDSRAATPQVIRSTRPEYPEAALAAGHEGYVDLRFTAAADGTARDIAVVGSQPQGVFDDAAVRAFENWRFAPAAGDDKGAGERAAVRIRFQLAHATEE